ncbi:MAG: tRNA (adenine-N1)-methyltransferase [Conexivisphaerales archaeon]
MKKNKRISYDDFVLFYGKGKTWLVKLVEGRDLHTHIGKISISSVVGRPYGAAILSEKGETVYALRPTIEDFIMKCERLTQIVYPKDLGIIALEADIQPGSKVVEVGSGSGATTIFLANLVRPKGHVYSYEIREDFLRVAERNVKRAGLGEYVTFYNRDAMQGIQEEDVDTVLVDLGDPWLLVKECWRVLQPSGHFVGITPTMNQAEKLAEELRNNGFERIKCIEILLRNMEVRTGKTRPSTMMVGHTAYLNFATKVLKDLPKQL